MAGSEPDFLTGLSALADHARESAAAMRRQVSAVSELAYLTKLQRTARHARLEGLDFPQSWEVERAGFMRGLGVEPDEPPPS